MPALDAHATPDIARIAAHTMLLHEGARAYALLAARMPVVVIKGAATAPLVWRDGERSMTDVDLLVPAQRLREARGMFEALQGSGFVVVDAPNRPLGVRLHRAFTVKTSRGVMIDVHGAVAQRARWPHDVDGILARSVRAKLGREDVMRASDEDCVLIAALNEAKDEYALAVTSSIEDIARLAAQRSIAWDVVIARARAWRATVATWIALDRAQRARGAPIPAAVLDAMRPRRAAILERALTMRPATRPQGQALGLPFALLPALAGAPRRVRQAVLGPLLTDSPARFAASGAAFVAVRSIDAATHAATEAVASLRRFIEGAAP